MGIPCGWRGPCPGSARSYTEHHGLVRQRLELDGVPMSIHGMLAHGTRISPPRRVFGEPGPGGLTVTCKSQLVLERVAQDGRPTRNDRQCEIALHEPKLEK